MVEVAVIGFDFLLKVSLLCFKLFTRLTKEIALET